MISQNHKYFHVQFHEPKMDQTLSRASVNMDANRCEHHIRKLLRGIYLFEREREIDRYIYIEREREKEIEREEREREERERR